MGFSLLNVVAFLSVSFVVDALEVEVSTTDPERRKSMVIEEWMDLDDEGYKRDYEMYAVEGWNECWSFYEGTPKKIFWALMRRRRAGLYSSWAILLAA